MDWCCCLGFQASTSTTVASSSGIKRKGPAHDKIPKKHKMWYVHVSMICVNGFLLLREREREKNDLNL